MNHIRTSILYFIGLILIFSSCKVESQLLKTSKHNYGPYILYDDPYVDQILESERFIKSDFVLAGDIKSLHIIEDKAKADKGSSIKYFYNSQKEVIRMINYDSDLNVVMDRWFYKKMKYGGPTFIKKGIFYKSDKQIFSNDDTTNKIVVTQTFENGSLKETDSIYYERNYYPILIKNYNAYTDLNTTYKFEYDKNKISLYLLARQTGYHQGSKRVYDEKNRHLYVSRLTNIDFESLTYDVEDVKKEQMIWDGNRFQYIKSEIDTSYFNSKQNHLIRVYQSTRSNTYFSDNLLPLTMDYIDQDTKLRVQILYSYNEHGDLLKKQYINAIPDYENEKFIYLYDSNNNWIERKMFLNNKLFKTTVRKIEYN